MALHWLSCTASSRVTYSPPSFGLAERYNSSTAFTALRTSPPHPAATVRGTSSAQSKGSWLRSFSMLSARTTAGMVSSTVSGLNSNTVLRDSSAL